MLRLLLLEHAMNILIVYAHPEPQSLNGALNRFAARHLKAAGHQVDVSDLYAMGWKATLASDDFVDHVPGSRFDASLASGEALAAGRQAEDVANEQAKLMWADALILQFPLWWFTMPAILKGWVDRVYAYGLAYGVGEHSDQHWGDRYGEGRMAGKRAMLMVTTGGWASHYGPRGINGPIDELLFPIHHGVLHYPGFEVLPPFVVHHTGKVGTTRFAEVEHTLGQRLDTLFSAAPIAYRRQNGGDYEIPALTLKPEHAPGIQGFAAHVAPTVIKPT